MSNSLTTQRILSIDAFRGITILVMIFVNELAGVQGIPAWMKHVAADDDAMTFVDVVFPAFLFIVGMSIPFAINTRKAKGDSVLQLQGHIAFRTLGLLVLGVFMVNAESGYNEEAMRISIAWWSLLFYAAVILIWNIYTFENKGIVYVLRGVGVITLLMLAVVYKGGEDGSQSLTPQWWGILGLIGWAYLAACILYQLSSGKIIVIMLMSVLCIVYYAIGRADFGSLAAFSQGGHAVHTCIVLLGIILSLIFFDNQQAVSGTKRFLKVLVLAVALIATGYLLRPYYTISKIYATPTWALYSAASCVVIYSFLYWLMDIQKVSSWTAFIRPAASNPLLTYIIPSIVYWTMQVAGVSWPSVFYQGLAGIVWSLVFAITIMALVMGLNRLKIKLQL